MPQDLGAAHRAATRVERFVALRFPLLLAGALSLLELVVLALLWAPSLSLGFSDPVAQRIFYLHIGAAIASYAAFSVTFVASLAVLRRGPGLADTVAEESARLGRSLRRSPSRPVRSGRGPSGAFRGASRTSASSPTSSSSS